MSGEVMSKFKFTWFDQYQGPISWVTSAYSYEHAWERFAEVAFEGDGFGHAHALETAEVIKVVQL